MTNKDKKTNKNVEVEGGYPLTAIGIVTAGVLGIIGMLIYAYFIQ